MTIVRRLVRRNLVLGVLAVGLAAVLALRASPTSALRTESLPRLFPDLHADDVGEIDLVVEAPAAGGAAAATPPAVQLRRGDDGHWVVASAGGYPADPARVTDFLQGLEQARRKGPQVTEDATTFDRYAGPEGWVRVDVRGAGGRELAAFALGKSPGWPEAFVRVKDGGTDRVVRAYNLTPDRARPGVDAWVEARIFPSLAMPDVRRVDVFQRDEKRTLSFARQDAPAGEEGATETWRMLAPQEAEAERFPVEGLVRTVTGLRLQNVLGRVTNDAARAEQGLDAPAYRVVLLGDDPGDGHGAPRYVLEVGRAVDGQDAWVVRRGDQDWVFTVAGYAIGDLRKAPGDFLPKPETPEEGGATPPAGDATGSPDEETVAPPGDAPPAVPGDGAAPPDGEGHEGGDVTPPPGGDAPAPGTPGDGDGDGPEAPDGTGEGG